MTGHSSVSSKPTQSEDHVQHSDSPAQSSPRSSKSASAFRTISEVADMLDVQQHVLRFWETKFSQVRPLKRGGGRRYYRPEDVELLQAIHHLLYTQGYTIKGVQKLLKEQGKNNVIQAASTGAPIASAAPVSAAAPSAQPLQQPSVVAAKPSQQAQDSELNHKARAVLEIMLDELKALRNMVQAD